MESEGFMNSNGGPLSPDETLGANAPLGKLVQRLMTRQVAAPQLQELVIRLDAGTESNPSAELVKRLMRRPIAGDQLHRLVRIVESGVPQSPWDTVSSDDSKLPPSDVKSAVKPATATRSTVSFRDSDSDGMRSAMRLSPRLLIAGILSLVILVSIAVRLGVHLQSTQGGPHAAHAAGTMELSDRQRAMLAVFNTHVAVDAHRWKSIYIHHSGTTDGHAGACSDHFLIGNGNGAQDGAVQFTGYWDQQTAAQPGGAVARIDPDCISICVVGDFDRRAPTPAQLQQLELLVQTLQERLRVPATRIWIGVEQDGNPCEIGRLFPRDAFRRQLMR